MYSHEFPLKFESALTITLELAGQCIATHTQELRSFLPMSRAMGEGTFQQDRFGTVRIPVIQGVGRLVAELLSADSSTKWSDEKNLRVS
jgi:hypothetical protein